MLQDPNEATPLSKILSQTLLYVRNPVPETHSTLSRFAEPNWFTAGIAPAGAKLTDSVKRHETTRGNKDSTKRRGTTPGSQTMNALGFRSVIFRIMRVSCKI